MHLGSWRDYGHVTYRGIAGPLADYLLEQGFTHVEFLPLMEHPFYGSWGYQSTGYFAADLALRDPRGPDVSDRLPPSARASA